MEINFRNISSISPNASEALDSVTGGLVASVDAKGMAAVQSGIDAFSTTGFDQAVLSGPEKPIAADPAAFSSPAEYLQQIPESGSPQVLENLEDPHFRPADALSSVFKNVFGDGGLNDVANQVGMAPTDSTQSPEGERGGPQAMGDGSALPNDDGAGPGGAGTSQTAGPNPLEASFPTRRPEEEPANIDGLYRSADPSEANPLESAIQLSDLTSAKMPGTNPLESAIQLSDLTSGSSLPGEADVSKIKSGDPSELNPLRSAIQMSDLTAAPASGSPGDSVSDGPGGGGIHITDTGEGGASEAPGEIIWQTPEDSMAIMGQRGSPIIFEGAANPAQSPFFLDLFQNNFSKLQTMGGTLNDLLTMQKDLLDHQ